MSELDFAQRLEDLFHGAQRAAVGSGANSERSDKETGGRFRLRDGNNVLARGAAKPSAAKLSFSNSLIELNPGDGRRGRLEGREAKHRSSAALDAAMILLDEVIQVSRRAHFDGAPLATFSLQLSHCPVRGLVPIERYTLRCATRGGAGAPGGATTRGLGAGGTLRSGPKAGVSHGPALGEDSRRRGCR